MTKKFKKIKDGQLVRPKMDGYLIGCCDCGLVHRIDFEITRMGILKFRAYRDDNSTKKLRKRMIDENEVKP
jgi:hypothetical protein